MGDRDFSPLLNSLSQRLLKEFASYTGLWFILWGRRGPFIRIVRLKIKLAFLFLIGMLQQAKASNIRCWVLSCYLMDFFTKCLLPSFHCCYTFPFLYLLLFTLPSEGENCCTLSITGRSNIPMFHDIKPYFCFLWQFQWQTGWKCIRHYWLATALIKCQ